MKRARLPGLSPALVARLAKDENDHKYDHGHALVLSGGVGQGGAARLAARAALRVGAGLVTLGCPPVAMVENAAQLNAVMLRPVSDAAALNTLLQDPRYTALCLGPGLGLSSRMRNLIAAALEAGLPTVLDADALSGISDHSAGLFPALHGDCILTPHDGEFARLFPQEAKPLLDLRDGKLEEARRHAVRNAAETAGCTILLKGPVTLICGPSGQTAEVRLTGRDAVPWLATAGSGDVLAGLIAGLLARGYSTIQAAETGAGLHAAAARQFGPGLIAEDISETLPAVFRSLGL